MEAQTPSNANSSIDILQMEYKSLSDALEKHALASYQALLLGAGAAAGLALYTSDGMQAGLGGITLAYGITILSIGLNFIHSVVCGIGLRLIEIEIQINRLTRTRHWDGIHWYSRFIGSGFSVLPGYKLTAVLTIILGITGVALGLWKGAPSLSKELLLPLWAYRTIICVPIVLCTISIAHFPVVMLVTIRKKNALLREAGIEPETTSLFFPF